MLVPMDARGLMSWAGTFVCAMDFATLAPQVPPAGEFRSKILTNPMSTLSARARSSPVKLPRNRGSRRIPARCAARARRCGCCATVALLSAMLAAATMAATDSSAEPRVTLVRLPHGVGPLHGAVHVD